MMALAFGSLRFRASSFVASFIAMFLGAMILMTFASMLDTAQGTNVPAESRETLTIMASIVGGWGLLIVVFAVTSTLSLSVHQRGAEIALLKAAGATPAQIGRLIVAEAGVLAIIAALAAIPPAVIGGRLLLELLISTDQVAPEVAHRFGLIALGMGFAITVVAATLAAVVTARRITRLRATESLMTAATDAYRTTGKQRLFAWFFLVVGISLGVVTATYFNGKGTDAMQSAGSASIFTAIGLALFAPVLVRTITTLVARPLEPMGGASGYLTILNAQQRTQQLASALMPIILFTAIATGTIYMQSIENSVMSATGQAQTTEQKNIETLNFVVVGMVALFAAIMLINTLTASTAYRRREFGQQRLAGATPSQILAMVGLESIVLIVAGVLFGSIASLVTIVPFSIARTDSVLPNATIGIYFGVVTIATTLTLVSSLVATRRALRMPAVQAVTA